MNGAENDSVQTRELCTALESLLPQYDVVIVTDYGHGMLGQEAVELLCDHSRFLAINTQANADGLIKFLPNEFLMGANPGSALSFGREVRWRRACCRQQRRGRE